MTKREVVTKAYAAELDKDKPKTSKLKVPSTPGACADLLYQKKQTARELAKPLEEVEGHIKQLEAHLIETLPADDADGVIGKLAKVVINRTEVATVKTWEDLYAFIIGQALTIVFLRLKQNAPKTPEAVAKMALDMAKVAPFDLMQRRVSTPAVLARKEDGVTVPGTESFFAKKVSCTKRISCTKR